MREHSELRKLAREPISAQRRHNSSADASEDSDGSAEDKT